MQHQTPQFIEIEDKVVGPFTVKQFIFIAGGAGFLFLAYTFLPFLLFLIVGTPIVALSGALAFFKYNEQPFIKVLENAVKFITGPKLFLWRHRKPEDVAREQASIEVPQKVEAINPAVGLSSSKLKNKSWNLEISDQV